MLRTAGPLFNFRRVTHFNVGNSVQQTRTSDAPVLMRVFVIVMPAGKRFRHLFLIV
jgi:hypothetical protein